MIKKLYNYNFFKTDLTQHELLKQFNPGFYTNSVEILKWFDEHFNINWDMLNNNAIYLSFIGYYNNPILYKLIYNNTINTTLINCIKWLVLKNPRYVYTQEYSRILKKCLLESFSFKLVRFIEELNIVCPIYDEGDDGGEIYEGHTNYIYQPIWDQFVFNIKKKNLINLQHKMCFIWAVLNNKITNIPLGLMRRFCLTINDFKYFEKTDHSNILTLITNKYNNNNLHTLCIFPDNENSHLKVNEDLYDKNIIPSTKRFCIKEKDKMIKFLKSVAV